MGENVSGRGTGAPSQVGYRVGYQFWTPHAMGAQFAQAKPKGTVVDRTQNWRLTSYNHNLDVGSQRIGYAFLGSTSSELSVMLCGEGLG